MNPVRRRRSSPNAVSQENFLSPSSGIAEARARSLHPGFRATLALPPRDVDEHHRASTTLELVVDLAFVVAVSQAASSLHHGLGGGDVRKSIVGFVTVFFAIWWAWMSYTWFGSAFDNDDVLYRIALFVQIAGVVVLAAGVSSAFAGNFAFVTIGYVIMRIAAVFQWWRVSLFVGARPTARRYAIGIFGLQVGWIGILAISPPINSVCFGLLVLGEFSVPIFAEREQSTAWHPGRIVERFGLLTIIVIGESITSAMISIKAGIDTREHVRTYVAISLGALLTVGAMWWLYFGIDQEAMVGSARRSSSTERNRVFGWAYGHFVVFAALAAVGASISVATESVAPLSEEHHALMHPGIAYTVPVAVYLVTLFFLHRKSGADKGWKTYLVPMVAVIMLPLGLLDQAVLVGGLVLSAMIAVLMWPDPRSTRFESTT